MTKIPKSAPESREPSKPIQVHGVLIRVFGTGVLIVGDSGIGKSECALDLVSKGHKLVADDVVVIGANNSGSPIGTAPDLTAELLEIRGLGIINIRTLFGRSALKKQSEIDLCVELRRNVEVERLGNVMATHELGGYQVPKFVLPVSPGRNLSTLIETAVRLFRQLENGANASDLLIQRHDAILNPIR